MRKQPYTEEFYRQIDDPSSRSAREIVPLLLELVGARSVVDIGCGRGTWLRVFEECGVRDIVGADGSYVESRILEIPAERFIRCDLTAPVRIDRQFDLVVSLEVAEHLPPECAEIFVDSLTRLGPVIVFSAAIPFQGGRQHINEQWPDYWASHFRRKGYLPIDCIRKRVWQNEKVHWWYAQNILLFVRTDYLESSPLLKREFEATAPNQLSIVHPKRYLAAADVRNMPFRKVLVALPASFLHGLKRTIGKTS